jgi:dTDP-4-dehydrorhamnose 3,5-epimerase
MSERFDFLKTSIPGLSVIRRKPILDSRGCFTRFFCVDEFKEVEFDQAMVQINTTLTKGKGTVRGLHYQKSPNAEIKLVSCVKGEIFDVAVDVRRNSPTFLKWHAEFLSEENQTGLYIPKGFAHGFQAITPDCRVLYMHSERYDPISAAGLNADDPTLAIDWPLPISERSIFDTNIEPIDGSFEGVEA